jgi:hypothetical protein
MRQAAQRIDQIADPSTQANLMAASRILAGLKLEEDMIYRILRRDIMRESVVQFANTCIRDKDTPSRMAGSYPTGVGNFVMALQRGPAIAKLLRSYSLLKKRCATM